jgi:hypothetical protein
MKVRHFGIAAGSIVAMCGLVVACSDDSTSSTSSSGSSSGGSSSGSTSSSSSGGSSSGSTSSSSSSGGANACEIAPGTYTVKSTRTAGDPAKCPEASNDIEIKETDGGKSDVDAGSACKVTVDEANCSSVIECTYSTSGFTTTTKSTFSTKTLTGSNSSKTVKDSDGSVLSECSYDVSWTKK